MLKVTHNVVGIGLPTSGHIHQDAEFALFVKPRLRPVDSHDYLPAHRLGPLIDRRSGPWVERFPTVLQPTNRIRSRPAYPRKLLLSFITIKIACSRNTGTAKHIRQSNCEIHSIQNPRHRAPPTRGHAWDSRNFRASVQQVSYLRFDFVLPSLCTWIDSILDPFSFRNRTEMTSSGSLCKHAKRVAVPIAQQSLGRFHRRAQTTIACGRGFTAGDTRDDVPSKRYGHVGERRR